MDTNLQSDFSDSSVVVTGASRGIGRSVVEMFCREGANVTGTARSETSLKKTLEEAEELGGTTIAVPGNVRQSEDAKDVINAALGEFGSVDVLVNNAGITRDQLLLRMDEEDWQDVLDINLGGTFHFTKSVARQMLKQKSGRIINITSVVGLRGNAGQSNYVASKAGIVGFTKSIARELGSRGITVNAIAPGYIETNMTEELEEGERDKILDNIPLDRLGRPEDVAEAVRFLSSESASYITGQVLVVDGGLYM